MTGPGLGGSARPKPKAGDYERALALITELGGDKHTKAYLSELVTATATYDAARTAAETAEQTAATREQLAHEAEMDAKSQRAALATETEQTDTRLRVTRIRQETEGERLLAMANDLKAKRLELETREAALRRAFDAYTQE